VVGERFERRRSEGSSEGIQRVHRRFPHGKPSAAVGKMNVVVSPDGTPPAFFLRVKVK